MKKTVFKRTLCIIVAAVMLCSVFASTAAAASRCRCGHSPVIMVSGFGATALAEKQADGSLKKVFPPDMSKILSLLGANAGDLLGGIAKLIGIYEDGNIEKPLREIVTSIVEPLRMNPDGSSYYDIVPIISGAQNTSLEAFTKNDQLDLVPYTGSEFLDMEVIGDEIGDDHVFNFLYDWRLSHVEVAAQFRDYIKEVLAITGHDKVSVYSISQGSLVVGAYMYEYPDDDYIDRAVFDTPLLEGSDLITDLYSVDPLSLNFDTALEIVGNIFHTEADLSFIMDIIPEDGANWVADYGLKSMVIPTVIYIPSFWEMCSPESYEALKAHYLDEDENAELIAKVEYMRNGFMSHVSQTFKAQQAKGVDISIKACSGSPLASGTEDNSDGIVNLKYSCGATCAPFGETFESSYVQAVDTGKNNISPDRTIDLSTGYLPERTWIVNRHYHGQAEWDPRTYDLLMELLLTDNIKDAYSHFEYPQFMESEAPTSDVIVLFKCTNSSFLPTLSKHLFKGNSVIIKNLSNEDRISISSVSCAGGSLKFNAVYPIVLEPGQSIEVSFTGSVPAEDIYDSIDISYRRVSLTADEKTRSFGFTITHDYSGIAKTDLTPAYLITAIQIANQTAKIIAQIGAVIGAIKGTK